jgi:hypothetical protein
MVVPEPLTISPAVEVLSKRFGMGVEFLKVARRRSVEPAQIPKHRPKTGPDRIAGLSEKCRETGPGILETTVMSGNRKRHFRFACGDTEKLEQRDQIRVGLLIENDKSRINMDLTVWTVDRHRVRMAPETMRTLEKGYIMPMAEKPRSGEAGDTRTDDSNPETR